MASVRTLLIQSDDRGLVRVVNPYSVFARVVHRDPAAKALAVIGCIGSYEVKVNVNYPQNDPRAVMIVVTFGHNFETVIQRTAHEAIAVHQDRVVARQLFAGSKE